MSKIANFLSIFISALVSSNLTFAGLVVNTDDNGPGSLRQEIADALSGDTITFDPALSGQTITLTSGTLEIDKSLTIDGAALNEQITISGQDRHRIFSLSSGSTTLASLTLTDARSTSSGSAIYNAAKLHLHSCTLTRNGDDPDIHDFSYDTRGTIYCGNSSRTTITDSTISENSAEEGGAIFFIGQHLSITNSKICDNRAKTGGAINKQAGHLIISNSTISHNSSEISGGGIYSLHRRWASTGAPHLEIKASTISHNSAGSRGAGLCLLGYRSAPELNDWWGLGRSSTFQIHSSTIANNSANEGGGIYYSAEKRFPQATLPSALSIHSSTISDNTATVGGGLSIFNQDELDKPLVVNSILSGNNAETSPNILGPITEESHHNLLSAPPRLAPLGDYGGNTQTMPPFSDSPAIDGGDNDPTILFDQRGGTRVINEFTDIGAVEAGSLNEGFPQPPAVFEVTSNEDELDTVLPLDEGDLSLREAIRYAPANTTITISPSLSGQTIELTKGPIFVSSNLTIDGSMLPVALTLDAQSDSKILDLQENTQLNIHSLQFTNGHSTRGGAIRSSGNLIVEKSTFFNNEATSNGGALYCDHGSLTINSSTLTGNTAINNGGAVAGNNSTLSFEASTITRNGAHSAGGINNIDGTSPILLKNTIVAGNFSPSANHDLEFGPNIIGPLQAESSHNLTAGNPQLLPLSNYGGPTLTSPPISNSPAIDAGGTTNLNQDQRGASREINSVPDIGAVEFGALPGSLPPAPLTEFIVTTTEDELDTIFPLNADDVSLREALTHAESGSTITFSTDLSGETLRLTLGELPLNGNVIVDGSNLAEAFTIDAQGASRVITIYPGSTLTLEALTLTGGVANQGGAISTHGVLTLNTCTIRDNTAQDQGGAIFNAQNAQTSINKSALFGNHGRTAGALYCSQNSAIHLTNSTLANNSANSGGVISLKSELVSTINSSTISENRVNYGPGALDGIRTSGAPLFLQNSIVVGNNSSGGSSLEMSNISLTPESTHNLLSGIPYLAPLEIYGGPTKTMPPYAGSPAIDSGKETELTSDQRLGERVINGTPDIGAVEVGGIPGSIPAPPLTQFVVSSLEDTLTSPSDLNPENLSLREALAYAPSGTSVTFAPALAGQTLPLSEGHLHLRGDLNIDASSLASPLTIDAQQLSRHFVVHLEASVHLSRLKLINGMPKFDEGGAIYSSGQLTISHSEILHCKAHRGGGAIYCRSNAPLTLSSSTLAHNTCDHGSGGAIDTHSRLTINNSTIAKNTASYLGGAIFSDSPDQSSVISSTISDNTAKDDEAGAIYGKYPQSERIFHISNSIVAGNFNPSTYSKNIEDITLTADSSHNIIDGKPYLAPLGYYGGETQTMPPYAGSPAIDAGTDTLHALDQRGADRIINGQVDLGAVEFGALPGIIPPPPLNSTVVNSVIDKLNAPSQLDEDSLSLREAILYSPPGAHLTFAPELAGQTMFLTMGRCTIFGDLTIDGSSLDQQLTIDAQKLSQIFKIQPGVQVHLSHLSLSNGFASGLHYPDPEDGKGGAIGNGGNLTFSHGEIFDCGAETYGGGFYSAEDSSLSIIASTIHNNDAAFGGGIMSESRLNLESSTIAENTASSGAGVYVNEEVNETTIMSSTISDNAAIRGVGGIDMELLPDQAIFTIQNSIIADNSSEKSTNQANIDPRWITTESSHNILSGDPALAPLDYYGGTTQTMPPSPNSEAIDSGGVTSLAFDQRGFPRITNDLLDIGAVEFRPQDEIAIRTLPTADADGDTLSNALEFALGRDPFLAEKVTQRNLQLQLINNVPHLSFGFNEDSADSMILKLTRSTDLQNFSEILLSNETTSFPDTMLDEILGHIDVESEGKPVFYRLEVHPRP